jgi:acetyltransferase-like isoleucine patch superfamily enzyme
MRGVLLGLVFISPPFLKKLLLKWFCGAKIGRRARIGWFSAVMGREIQLGEHSIIRPLTLISVAGRVSLGDYSEISSFSLVYGSSGLIIGDQSYVGPQSLINCDEEVRLGHQSALGPRCMVFTHGSFLPYTEGYWVKLAGVTVGDRVWCAAGVFLHPGVEIGDDTFVNARSVLTQSVPAGSVVEGNPARVVYPMERMKRKMSPRRVDAAVSQLLHDFAEIGLRRELGLEAVEESEYQLRFDWRGEHYQIALIPSAGDLLSAGEPDPDVRQILVVNHPDWSPPPGAAVFDLATGQTPFDSGHIHSALRLFMQRYYGIRFSDRALAQSGEGSG